MRTHITGTLFIFMVTALSAGCSEAPHDGEAEQSTVLDQLPNLQDGKADGQIDSAEKRAILLRMKKRLPEQRRLKAALNIGETFDGYVTIPPEASTLADDSGEASAIQQFINDENADRSAYYEYILEGHAREIRRGLDSARETIRADVAAQLCKELPPGTPCEQIAETAIDAALEAAFDVTVDESLAPIREEIERVHARFWQTRTTREGEWVEVRNGKWRHKPASSDK